MAASRRLRMPYWMRMYFPSTPSTASRSNSNPQRIQRTRLAMSSSCSRVRQNAGDRWLSPRSGERCYELGRREAGIFRWRWVFLRGWLAALLHLPETEAMIDSRTRRIRPIEGAAIVDQIGADAVDQQALGFPL